MQRVVAVIFPVLILLSACGGSDPVQVETDPPRHEMRLQSAGAVNGSFAVTAAAPSAQPVNTQPFVYATAGTSNGRPATKWPP